MCKDSWQQNHLLGGGGGGLYKIQVSFKLRNYKVGYKEDRKKVEIEKYFFVVYKMYTTFLFKIPSTVEIYER